MRTILITAGSRPHVGPELALPILGTVLLALSALFAVALIAALAF